MQKILMMIGASVAKRGCGRCLKHDGKEEVFARERMLFAKDSLCYATNETESTCFSAFSNYIIVICIIQEGIKNWWNFHV